MFSVAWADSHWAALGWAANDGEYDSGAWTSPDGIRWTRAPSLSSPQGRDATAVAMTWTGREFIAAGTISGESGSGVAVWTSPDGTSWLPVPTQAALSDGTPNALISHEGLTIIVGVREAETDHWIPVAYVAGD
jgi:hypothetical protein